MPAKFSIFTVAAMPLIPIALACGGDDDGGGNRIMVQPDANNNGGIDAPMQVNCSADPSYAGVLSGSGAEFAEAGGSGSNESLTWGGVLTDPNSGPFDVLQVELYEGFTVFSGGIAPTNVTLTGAETGYDTCGACVRLLGDIVVSGMSGTVTQQYFATGGTLNITSTTGSFQGTISNLTLQHVDIDMNTLATTPNASGCTTSLSSVTMNATIDTGSAAVAIPGEIPVRLVIKNRKQL